MSDLISRQAVLKHIEKIRQSVQMMDDTHRADIIMNGVRLCKKAVESVPSVEERKKGEWIEANVKGMDYVYCSECEDSYYPVPIDPSWNFCPNCGTDMRGVKKCQIRNY